MPGQFHGSQAGLENRGTRRSMPENLVVLDNTESSVADIILICDLTDRTWMTPEIEYKKLWPNYRVLGFEYTPKSTQASLGDIVSHSDVEYYAKELIEDLTCQRLIDNDELGNRPIVFIAHGLGGVICEQALVTLSKDVANEDKLEPDGQSIIDLTRRVILLGTPHYRAGIAEWSLISAERMGMNFESAQQQAFSSIEESLKSLADMQKSFRDNIMEDTNRRRSKRITIVTCVFSRSRKLGSKLILSPEWAILPGSRVIAFEGDHFSMTNLCDARGDGIKLIMKDLDVFARSLHNVDRPSEALGKSFPRPTVEPTAPTPSKQPPMPEDERWIALIGRVLEPDGVIALGNIIHSVTEVDKPLVTVDEVQATLSFHAPDVCVKKEKFHVIESGVASSSRDTYIEFLKSIDDELRNKTNHEVLQKHRANAIVTCTLNPGMEYVSAVLATPAAQKSIWSMYKLRFSATLYIVTGIRYVVGASSIVKSTHHKASQVRTEATQRENELRNCVFAFRVQSIQIGDWLNNLAGQFGTPFEQSGSMEDLNRAIEVAGMAIDTKTQDTFDRATMLSGLGNLLGTRFVQTGSMDDLNRAIEVADIAVKATPKDDVNRAGRLSVLGSLLRLRYERTSFRDDINCALLCCEEGWNSHNAPPSLRSRLARHAADILASQSMWEKSSLLLEEAVNLLPVASPRLLKHTDKRHMLADSASLASIAAATALNAEKTPYHALRLLELGRDVYSRDVMNHPLMDTRGDISVLEEKNPDLAHQFVALRDELDSPSSWESKTQQRREAEKSFENLTAKIRGQPGFERFLLPLTPDELMAAADPGPIIVINSSPYRCDAFLITRTKISVLPLPGLNLRDVRRRAQILRSSCQTSHSQISPLLEWLWDVVACPCLEALGYTSPISDDNWPHVWWIPTGYLSQFPFHAAGRLTRGSTDTVLDRVMSSYASSVKELVYGRRNPPTRSNQALLVATPETPGLQVLPYATVEVDMLSELCRLLQLQPIRPTPLRVEVLERLQSCRIFHFAGHSWTNPMEPSQSHLLLKDWQNHPLTVGDIRDLRLQEDPPFLAYLSTCASPTNEMDRLGDEEINLLSAFQLAGFRHVIGALWEVSDKEMTAVASIFYDTIRDEGLSDIAVCRGLHRATRAVRFGGIRGSRDVRGMPETEQSSTSMHWISYFHFGV